MSRGFRVEGRVQGVGFRDWVVVRARALGVEGYVVNLPDGAVEVQARGAPGRLRSLEEELEQGPRSAAVQAVRPVEAAGDLPSGRFEVRWSESISG